MKTVVNHDFGAGFEHRLQADFPQLDIHRVHSTEQAVAAVADAKILVGELRPEIFAAAEQLEWHQYVGIGFNHYMAIPGFSESDLVVTNCRETHVIPMADHVFAGILAFAHTLPALFCDQRNHVFDETSYLTSTIELPGTTMGVLAMGDIGSAVAKRAQGFDMEGYGVDIAAMEPPPGVKAVWPLDRLDEMLAISDWLVITAPLTDQTRNLIDAERLRRLKPGCHIVIVSRGGIVNEEDLIEALRGGVVAGAAIDAFTEEPLPPDSPLWELSNVIITPHSSAGSPQLWQRRADIAYDNIRRYLAGEPLRFVCDKRLGY